MYKKIFNVKEKYGATSVKAYVVLRRVKILYYSFKRNFKEVTPTEEYGSTTSPIG